jgi:AmmeMemoRadiSam system protein A
MLSLCKTDRDSLLGLARLAITQAVSRGEILGEIPVGGIFSERRGVFVSLHIGKRLRGCIGLVDPQETLGNSIVRCAAGAALHDPRFSAMRVEELSDLHIEISLLSTLFAICLEQIEIGKHGLLIWRGRQRGLLLPQVAARQRLSAEQFLAETCKKAQMAPDAWRDPEANLFGFTCEIFSSGAREVLRPPSAELAVPLATKLGEQDGRATQREKLAPTLRISDFINLGTSRN